MADDKVAEDQVAEDQDFDVYDETKMSLLEYLSTEIGSVAFQRLLDALKSAYKDYVLLEKRKALKEFHTQRIRHKLAIQTTWIKAFLIFTSMLATTALIILNRFDSTAALFFGSIVAYLLGRSPRGEK